MKMEKVMIFYVSECCGVESDADHQICSRCGEHCEIITEEYERDDISGYDDGECEMDETGGLDEVWDDGWRW